MYEETDYFEAMNGRKFMFVGMKDNNTLIVWEHRGNDHGWRTERLGALDVHSVDIDTLKKHNLWDSLMPEVQQEITNGVVEEKKAVHDLMSKARMSRKQRYANVPRELVCPLCGHKKVVSPGALVKKADEIAKERNIIYTVQDIVKDYVCKRCKKLSNPSAIPLDMVCIQCGKIVQSPKKVIEKRVEKKGITLEQYLSTFSCQICSPMKRGRKSSGMAKVDLACSCGYKITYPMSIVQKTLDGRGLTLEQYAKGYKCKKCRKQ